MNKKNLLVLTLCALSSFAMVGCGGSNNTSTPASEASSQQEEAFGAAKNFTISASNGDYSFSRVNGAAKYKIYIYKAEDYNTETNTVVPAEDGTNPEAQYEATVKQKDAATITGTVSWVAEGAWGKYVAVLEAQAEDGTKAVTTYSYVHGGKLNTPEFYVYQGTSGGGFGGGGGGNPPAPEGGDSEGDSAEAPAPTAAEGGTSEEAPAPGGEGGGMPNMGGDSSSSSAFVMQITVNTDNYLTKQYETQAVYSFAYTVKDASGNVVASSDCFADNIQPANFTLYTNNSAKLETLSINGVDTPLTELYGNTYYVSIKANGCAEDNVEDSDWTEAFEITLKEGSSIPFDSGFGRASNMGGF